MVVFTLILDKLTKVLVTLVLAIVDVVTPLSYLNTETIITGELILFTLKKTALSVSVMTFKVDSYPGNLDVQSLAKSRESHFVNPNWIPVGRVCW